jgi:hypothetical protein
VFPWLRRLRHVYGVELVALCRHPESILLFHQLESAAIGLVSMFDCVHAGGQLVADAFRAVGVGGHFDFGLVGLLDDGPDLLDGQCGSTLVRISLEQVRAMSDLFSRSAKSLRLGKRDQPGIVRHAGHGMSMQSMSPGKRVASPRSTTSAPAGTFTEDPADVILSP